MELNVVNRNLLLDFKNGDDCIPIPPVRNDGCGLSGFRTRLLGFRTGLGMRWSRIWRTERSSPDFRSMSAIDSQSISTKQWQTINVHMGTNRQDLTAKKLSLNESTVSRNLRRGFWWQIQETRQAMERVIATYFPDAR